MCPAGRDHHWPRGADSAFTPWLSGFPQGLGKIIFPTSWQTLPCPIWTLQKASQMSSSPAPILVAIDRPADSCRIGKGDRARSSVMLMADLRMTAFANPVRIRVRDISKGGLKGSGIGHMPSGSEITVELPNIGLVRSRVVWSNQDNFGLVFDHQIDVQTVKTKITGNYVQPMPNREPEKRKIW